MKTSRNSHIANNMKISLLGKILDLMLPRTCAICSNRLVGSEEMICCSCLLAQPWTDFWAHPYDNEMAKCFWHLIPIERSSALYYHVSHTTSARPIYQLKYGHRQEMGIYLGEFLASKGLDVDFFEGIDAIIPLPLAPKREKERGYNQSLLIAKGISHLTHLPIIKDAVSRTVFHESQTHKNRRERLTNVEHVFCLNTQYHDQEGKHPICELADKHLLLVDDVCTTGATIISCAQELQKAGKMRFSVLTIGFAYDL